MISMPQIQSIRRMRRNGESIASIARKQHVSEPTVRKYLRMDDLSEKPPVRKRRGSVADPYLPLIEQWLAEDRDSWRKQRHTATRIWERLRDEHGAEVSLSTVTRVVARLRRESAMDPGDAFMDLVWHPGEAQADFGEVDVLYRGAPQRMRHFVLDFPYSNIGLAQLMPGENAECTCQALLDLFEWLGGVPERIVFDNAAGVGRRTRGGEARWTRLFQAFQAHYGFESSLCSPYAGHEKGAVEAKVGMVRRKLFVPKPSVWNLENFNSGLPDRCLELGRKPHHAKDEEETGLFEEDRKALLPLPSRRFDVVTWKRMRADKYGVVTLDGRHRYSTDASHARRDVLVGLRALEIEILDVEGTRLAVHPRAYGQANTSSEDPSMQLAMLCNRPNAWPNSLVRGMLPDPLREWLDRQDETERRGALRTLKRVDRESGWANAVEVMLTTLEATGGVDGPGVALLAARLAGGVEHVEYDDDRPDLSEYDIAFTTTDAEGAE
nr:MAG TPA: transposase [Caudoviricetes sp.]